MGNRRSTRVDACGPGSLLRLGAAGFLVTLLLFGGVLGSGCARREAGRLEPDLRGPAALVKAREYGQAITVLTTTLKDHADWAEAYYLLYLAHARSGDAAAAAAMLADLEKAVEQGELGVEGWFWLARAYGEAGDPDGEAKAIARLEAAAEGAAALAEPAYWLGRAYLEMNQPTRAREALAHAVSLSPGDIPMRLWLGRALLQSGQYDKVREQAEVVVKLDADSDEAHFLMGQAHNYIGDVESAMASFERALELNPSSSAALHNLGVTYFQKQEYATAVERFREALELDPADPDTHYQLGAAYLVMAIEALQTGASESDLMAKAVAEFETAIELEPGMPEALIGLGNVYIQKGETDAAIEALTAATRAAPDSPHAHFALAEAHSRGGDPENACAHYQTFLGLEAPENWRAQARQAMSMLECP